MPPAVRLQASGARPALPPGQVAENGGSIPCARHLALVWPARLPGQPLLRDRQGGAGEPLRDQPGHRGHEGAVASLGRTRARHDRRRRGRVAAPLGQREDTACDASPCRHPRSNSSRPVAGSSRSLTACTSSGDDARNAARSGRSPVPTPPPASNRSTPAVACRSTLTNAWCIQLAPRRSSSTSACLAGARPRWTPLPHLRAGNPPGHLPGDQWEATILADDRLPF